MKLKPIFVDFAISRIDDDQRIVEGIAFANEVVPGEGGIRLKRSAMMAATEDYLKNGTCREMHQPSAVGKPLSVVWEGEKGQERAHLTAKIVDDDAWKKVKEEVYKGFSIGVIPRVVRGKDVETCQWWDTSLVDVGKDKEAKFTVFRMDGDMAEEIEVEELAVERGTERSSKLDSCTEVRATQAEVHATQEVEAEEIERAKWTQEKRDALPKADFGWPEERKYPISDQDDVDSAAKLIGKAPESMRGRIKARIKAIAKRKNLKVPDAWSEEAAERVFAEESIERGRLLNSLKQDAPRNLGYMAHEHLHSHLRSIANSSTMDSTDKSVAMREVLDDFAEFMEPIICAGELPDNDIFDPSATSEAERALSPTLTRAFEIFGETELLRAQIEESQTTISALTEERDKTSEELTRVQGLEQAAIERAKAAEEEVTKLKNMPRAMRPVVNPHLVPYRVGLGLGDEETTARAELERQLKEITDLAPTSDKKEGDRRIYEIQRIKHALRDIEGTAPPFA